MVFARLFFSVYFSDFCYMLCDMDKARHNNGAETHGGVTTTGSGAWRKLPVLLMLLLQVLIMNSAGAAVDPTALAIIERASSAAVSMKTFYVEVQSTASMANGVYPSTAKGWVTRPGNVLWIEKAPSASRACYITGNGIVVFNAKANQYDRKPVTKPLAEHTVEMGLMPPAVAKHLLSENSLKELVATAESATYTGQVVVLGVPCHQVSVKTKTLGYEMGFDSAGQLRSFKVAPLPSMTTPGATIESVFTYAPNQPIPDSTYAFTPPPGATQMKKAAAAMAQQLKKPGKYDDTIAAILNKPAPDVSLSKADGQMVQLASKRGQKVVLLDFWATWCGPCRASMPSLAELSREYAPKGVEVYAVNVAEQVPVVQQFLAKNKIDIPVLFDTDKRVSRSFMLPAYPYSVIIGKDGIIKNVHVGMVAKQVLSKELDAAIAGR